MPPPPVAPVPDELVELELLVAAPPEPAVELEVVAPVVAPELEADAALPSPTSSSPSMPAHPYVVSTRAAELSSR
jgi:hypothetical protein